MSRRHLDCFPLNVSPMDPDFFPCFTEPASCLLARPGTFQVMGAAASRPFLARVMAPRQHNTSQAKSPRRRPHRTLDDSPGMIAATTNLIRDDLMTVRFSSDELRALPCPRDTQTECWLHSQCRSSGSWPDQVGVNWYNHGQTRSKGGGQTLDQRTESSFGSRAAQALVAPPLSRLHLTKDGPLSGWRLSITPATAKTRSLVGLVGNPESGGRRGSRKAASPGILQGTWD